MTRRNRPGRTSGQRRWIVVGLAAWVLTGTLVGEFRDPPFDLVRFLVRVLLGGLVAWSIVWFITRSFIPRSND